MCAFSPTANKPYGDVQEPVNEQETCPKARERLELASNGGGVEEFLAYLDGDRETIDAEIIVRSLALLGGELCLEVAHEGSTEYIWLTDEWDGLLSRAVTHDATERGPVTMEASDLQQRVDQGKAIEVRLTEDVPLAGTGVPA